ncbi:MAG: hypothetical protein QQN63_03845 [Nitrosopumilus sp.]
MSDKGPASATEALGRLETAEKLPPFLNAQIRQREAYLTLIKDLTEHLGEEWSSRPEADCKARINSAIARSLEMWI